MRRLLILTFVVLGCVGSVFAQTLSSQDRALIMLKAARDDSGFKNNLIVLVDSESASAAEVFARSRRSRRHDRSGRSR